MSNRYDEYLKTHIENVNKGFDWLRTNIPELFTHDFDWYNITNHDKSKYYPNEYHAYDAYFYGGNRSYTIVQDFNLAWLLHIHRNPRHWQYWVLINDNPDEGEIILEMPYCYVVEMICDWWAFSWAKDNLKEIFSWWDEHKNYIKLHENTRKLVEGILDEMKLKIDLKEEE